MKNTVGCFAAFFYLLLLAPSCSKNHLEDNFTGRPAQVDEYINATVASGETYTFTCASSGTLSVSKQASHYRVSKTGTADGSAFYSYNSLSGYVGFDEVTLTHSPSASEAESSSGCPGSHNNAVTNTIVIKFNVTK